MVLTVSVTWQVSNNHKATPTTNLINSYDRVIHHHDHDMPNSLQKVIFTFHKGKEAWRQI